VKWVPGLS